MMFKNVAIALVAAMASQGVAAVTWQQFFSQGCSGTVENSGSYTGGRAPINGNGPQLCVPQQGASVNFVKSGGVSCSIFVFNDKACTDFAFDIGDGCQNFGGTGKSFGISC
jgi:hypothetical protein